MATIAREKLTEDQIVAAADGLRIGCSEMRLGILVELDGASMSVAELARATGIHEGNVTYQVALLVAAGAIEAERSGDADYYHVTEAGERVIEAAWGMVE